MQAIKKLQEFCKSEQGLVTVEWVGLASVMVIGAILIAWIVMDNMKQPASQIGPTLLSTEAAHAAVGS
jgi:hypothetical protein